MQAISKANHEKIIRLIETLVAIQSRESPRDFNKLVKLESELNTIFNSYQLLLNDIKTLIVDYNMMQRAIRLEMKGMLLHEKTGKAIKNVIYCLIGNLILILDLAGDISI